MDSAHRSLSHRERRSFHRSRDRELNSFGFTDHRYGRSMFRAAVAEITFDAWLAI